MNLFALDAKTYRDQRGERMDIMTGYEEQSALYLSRMRDIPYSEALGFVKSNIGEGKRFSVKSPQMIYAHSPTRGNKELGETTLWEYAKDVLDKDYILAPSLTAYVPPEIIEAPTSGFLIEQRAQRDRMKKAEFEAAMDGDRFAELDYNSQQNTAKRFQNSMSGAYLVASTGLYNRTGHSTLTSGCRCATSYTNASNERFIGGLRHYSSADVTIAAILASIKYDPYMKVKIAVEKYNLVIPTVDNVMDLIWESTKHNWRSFQAMDVLRELVGKMDGIERASFYYGGDMHHLEKLNPEFVEALLHDPIKEITEVTFTMEQADAAIKKGGEDILILSRYICSDLVAGIKWNGFRDKHPDRYRKIGQYADQIYNYFFGIKDVIDAFFQPTQLPVSIAKFPGILRKSVVLSDTDSSVFHMMEWVLRYCKMDWFSKRAYNVGYIVSYLATQQLEHLLAMYSSNIGLREVYIFRVKMKNEYYFPLTAITLLAKHYYGLASAQEGNVKLPENWDYIKKGVGLRGITSSKDSADALDAYIKGVMDKIMTKGGLTLAEALQPVLDFYENIINDIHAGGYRYLRSAEVKDTSGYTKGEDDPNVKNRNLWEQVFAPTYGPAPDPPYSSVTMSVRVKNKTQLAAWIEDIADKDLGQRMDEFVKKNMGGTMTTLRLPEQSIRKGGVPKEVRSILDVRKITAGIMLPWYLVLETLGIYFKNDKLTRIISDEWHVNLPEIVDDSYAPVLDMVTEDQLPGHELLLEPVCAVGS